MGRILDRLRGYSVVWFGFDPLPSQGILEFKGAAVTSVTNDRLRGRTVVTIDGPGVVAGVSSVTATAPITSTGGANPVVGIGLASSTVSGAMSFADKAKLDSMTAGAAVASVTGTAPIVSSGGTSPAISISPATSSAAGSMSAADKARLDAAPSFRAWLVGPETQALWYNDTSDDVSLSLTVIPADSVAQNGAHYWNIDVGLASAMPTALWSFGTSTGSSGVALTAGVAVASPSLITVPAGDTLVIGLGDHVSPTPAALHLLVQGRF